MRLAQRRTVRRGATLVEFGIVFLAFIMLVLGIIDLSFGVMHYNSLSQAARAGSRQAIVHGNTALGDAVYPRKTATWGTSTVSVKGDAKGDPISDAVRPYLGTLDPSTVTIKMEWPSGTNAQDDPVRVTVSAPYSPMITIIFGNITFNFQSASTMRIAF